ncbi:head completion adaptor [Vibrio phage LP.2]|nr:head completion adaptor [Vibrio phage LP.2]
MALTVQDPQNPVDNANSYLSLVDARALADQYYYDLPTDDTEAERALVKSFRSIELKEPQMCGVRTTEIQNTSYPRTGVYIRCQPLPSDAFPDELLLAQVIGASYSGSGTDLSGGTDDGRVITKEKVDVIEVNYADNGKTGNSVYIAEFENTLNPLLCSNTSAANFTTVRV